MDEKKRKLEISGVQMKVQKGNLKLMPPAEGTCPVCATKHEEILAHNLDSIYYQTRFFMQTGRAPDWRDAVYHCPPNLRRAWITALKGQEQELWPWADDAQPEPYPNDPDFLERNPDGDTQLSAEDQAEDA